MKILMDPRALEGNEPPSPEEFRQRGQEDASLDAQWFIQNPDVTERVRPPTATEVIELRLPLGSRVHVKKFSDGTQLRLCLVPKPGAGN